MNDKVHLYLCDSAERDADAFVESLSYYNPFVYSNEKTLFDSLGSKNFLAFFRHGMHWAVRFPTNVSSQKKRSSVSGRNTNKLDVAEFRFDIEGLVGAQRLLQQNVSGELLVKAVRGNVSRQKPLTVIDATAGLGRDALILAAAGYSVTLLEHNELLSRLVSGALESAAECDQQLVERMHCLNVNSIEFLRSGVSADVVYLDPMYREGNPASHQGLKKSAQVRKNTRLLQLFDDWYCQQAGESSDWADGVTAALDSALAAATRKVVVKRAPRAPWLGDRKPSYAVASKTVRFDVYVR